MIRLCLCTCWVDLSTRFSLFVMKCIKIISDTKFMLVSFDVNLMYTLINVRCTRAEKYCMNLQFRPGIIEYKRKISVALLHYIVTIVHIGFGIFQRNIESFSHTVLLSYK